MRSDKKKKGIKSLLSDLQRKQTRKNAFIELTNIGDHNSIEPLLDTIKRMTWDEALSVADQLGNFGVRIIPRLEHLLNPTEGSRVYTSAIKGLGGTKSEKAFSILFPLLKKEERWLLSNDVTFGVTIDALVSCGQNHLKEFMELLDSSNWLVRSGGAYACGKIASLGKQDRKLIKKLNDKFDEIVMEDRSAKVRELTAGIVNRMNEKEDMEGSYQEAMNQIQTEIQEEDLYEKYQEGVEQILGFMNHIGWGISRGDNYWEIEYPHYDNTIVMSLEKNSKTGENYLEFVIPIQKLPHDNILPLYRQLLEWNDVRHSGAAKFVAKEDWICLEDVRGLESLDPPEIVNAVQVLAEIAGEYSALMRRNF